MRWGACCSRRAADRGESPAARRCLGIFGSRHSGGRDGVMPERHVGPSGVPFSTLIVLMLAVFTVSIGYGVVLPLLPALLESLLKAPSGSNSISGNTGLLTSVYVLGLFLFAPLWGQLSDRYGRRNVLVLGILGFAGSLLLFSFLGSLPAFYAERFISGAFAAAVTPVAAAAVGDLAANDKSRGRRLTMISVAGITGFMLGPMLGLLIARIGAGFLGMLSPSGLLAIPLAATAVLALPVAVAVWFAVPGASHIAPHRLKSAAAEGGARLLFKLLSLAFIVSAAVGVFEVGLALRGKQELGLTQGQIALMFTECSLVMIVVQTVVFSPLVKPEATRWLISPALAVLAAGLFLVPCASNFALMLGVIGVVAASAGILLPIVTYWISTKAGNAQGAELGKQSAAASLGSAVGSALGGILFTAPFPGASFVLVSGITGLGVAMNLGLPRLLVRRPREGARPRHGLLQGARASDAREPLKSELSSGQGAQERTGPPCVRLAADARLIDDADATSDQENCSMSAQRPKLHSERGRLAVHLGNVDPIGDGTPCR